MKKKRLYEKPAMQVYPLQNIPHILAGSDVGGLNPLNPYDPGTDPLNH